MTNRMQISASLSLLSAGLLVGGFLGGCGGQNSGWVIKPAPTDETLTESVVQREPGLFVTDKIAVIDVDGLIFNEKQPSLFGSGENPVSLFVEKVDKAQADPNVKAVVVRINSPGGGVTASDIMYQRLMRLRSERKIPVISIIEDLGASGGFYVACAGDTIIAHPTSVTGSIGVIVQTVSFAGTMAKLGITAQAITSGKHKDMASPLKPLQEGDMAILQGIVDDLYGRFLGVVQKARPKLSAEQVKALADGRVYSGQQALANGLVDGLGYMNDALVLAKKEAGAARVKVVMYDRPLGYHSNVYSQSGMPAPQMNLLNVTAPNLALPHGPQLMYLWTGARD